MKGIFGHRGNNNPKEANKEEKVNRPRLWSTRSPSWTAFEEALDNLVLLRDGTLVAALEVVPIDTALMSREDVQAHLARYWQGLRTIQFPVSVFVGTRRQEVAGYLQVVTRRLDDLAEARGKQQGFFGMLLEEQGRLLEVLLAEHLRSRCSLVVVSHSPSSGLKGAARRMVGERGRASVSPDMVQMAKDELELKLKKVEDVLRHVGLRYKRCSGRRLAAEVQRLARPDLMAEDIAKLEENLKLPTVVGGDVVKGGVNELAFSTQG